MESSYQAPRGPTAIAWLVPLAVATAVFAPHIGNGFVYDEHAIVVSNPAVNGADPWRAALTRELWYASSDGQGAHQLYYRPAFVAALRLLWAVGGGAPWAFHLASLIVHLLNGTLAFVLLPRLGVPRPTAFAASALLLVHPLSGEVVYWGVTLHYAVVLACLLVTLIALGLAREAPSRRRTLQGAALAASAVAIFMHEIGFVVPILATAEALRAPRGTWRSRLRVAWPVWVPVPAYLAIRMALLPPARTPVALRGLVANAFRAGDFLAWDLGRLVVPVPLSPLHCLAAPEGTASRALGVGVLVAVAAAVAVLARRGPRELFWGAWILLPLAPSVALAFLGETGTPVAERFLFLSLLPALVLEVRVVAWLASRALPRYAILSLRAAALTAFAGAAWLTAGYGAAFSNDHAYYSRALQVCPKEPTALVGMGNEALERGDPASALPLFEEAIRSEPRRAISHLDVGVALKRLGLLDRALASLDRAVQLDGRLVPARLERVDLLRRLGRIDEAGAESAAIVAVAPSNADGRLNLGTYLFLRGETGAAVAQWEEGITARPSSCELRFNLAMGYAALSRRSEARSNALRFLGDCTDGFDSERVQAQAWIAP